MIHLYTFNDYQRESARTIDPKRSDIEVLTSGGLGLAGESGEVIELIKKHVFHGHALDKEKLTKEVGDALWYLATICTGGGIRLCDAAAGNVEKLKARYPDGFSEQASQNRVEYKEASNADDDGA